MHLPEPFGLTEEAFTTPTPLLGGHTLLQATVLLGVGALIVGGGLALFRKATRGQMSKLGLEKHDPQLSLAA